MGSVQAPATLSHPKPSLKMWCRYQPGLSRAGGWARARNATCDGDAPKGRRLLRGGRLNSRPEPDRVEASIGFSVVSSRAGQVGETTAAPGPRPPRAPLLRSSARQLSSAQLSATGPARRPRSPCRRRRTCGASSRSSDRGVDRCRLAPLLLLGRKPSERKGERGRGEEAGSTHRSCHAWKPPCRTRIFCPCWDGWLCCCCCCCCSSLSVPV